MAVLSIIRRFDTSGNGKGEVEVEVVEPTVHPRLGIVACFYNSIAAPRSKQADWHRCLHYLSR